MKPTREQNSTKDAPERAMGPLVEDVVAEIRRIRAALLEEVGGDLNALFDVVERDAGEIRSSRRKSA